MDPNAYAVEAAVEQDHWWFVGRRALLRRLIERSGVARTASVLDIGAGTGGNLRLLRTLGFSFVVGIDRSLDAAGFCLSQGLLPVLLADAKGLPLRDQCADLVLAT